MKKSHKKKFNIDRLCSVAVFCFVHDPTDKKHKTTGQEGKMRERGHVITFTASSNGQNKAPLSHPPLNTTVKG